MGCGASSANNSYQPIKRIKSSTNRAKKGQNHVKEVQEIESERHQPGPIENRILKERTKNKRIGVDLITKTSKKLQIEILPHIHFKNTENLRPEIKSPRRKPKKSNRGKLAKTAAKKAPQKFERRDLNISGFSSDGCNSNTFETLFGSIIPSGSESSHQGLESDNSCLSRMGGSKKGHSRSQKSSGKHDFLISSKKSGKLRNRSIEESVKKC